LTEAVSDPDASLVVRVGRGEHAAVRSLVPRKLPRILALARRLLGDAAAAEAVTLEVMLRAWREAPNWRPGGERFDLWLHREALSLCNDRPPVSAEPSDTGPAATDLGARTASAIAGLSGPERKAIVLCHYQRISPLNAAALMDVSVDALEALLARGRGALLAVLCDAVADGPDRERALDAALDAWRAPTVPPSLTDRIVAAAPRPAEPAVTKGAGLASALRWVSGRGKNR
jgi:RNA polymerase sigma-70 factor (ECF subfamily)